ncbi:MAG TPA: PKD domain-containing protein, partial [Candidatus Paceibacterota bacterium]|nr:PKD domain-containing protein [Candidatus Paceibacterota bacterium]
SSSLVSCGSYTGDQKPNVAVLNNDLKTASAQYLHSTQVKNGSFTGYSIVEAKKTTMNLSADKRVIKKVGEPVILTWSVENSLLSTIGGGGGGRADHMEKAVDEGGCNSVWDIINAECSPLDILNKITPQNNFANSFINLSNNLFAKIKSIFMQPTIAQTASQPVVFLFVGNAACHPEGDASDCDFAPNSYYPVLTNSGSLTVYPQSDTNFYLIVYGISGEGPKFFVSEPLEVSIEEDEQEEGRVDLKVKEDSSGHDYTDGPITISRGADISLKWSGEENLDSCIATASPENSAWQGKVATTGTKTIYGVTNSVIFKLDCTLKNGKAISDSATVNVITIPPPEQGVIEVKARLINGTSTTEYTGPVKYAINGRQSFTGEAPQSFTVEPGQYVLTYVSGGPSEAVCITPSKAGVVESQKTLTFYLDFEVQNLCSINVNYQVPASAASWDRKASYVLIGPTILTGNSLPYSFTQIPPGVYYISYISGAPENLVFSGVLEGNGQVCYPKQPLQFTLQFTEPGATPPVPLPSPEIGNNPPTAKIGCAADDPVRCIGTIDGDPDTPTITLYNASTDPDKDITSCTWTIQKQGQGGESISKRTCQPVTIGDDIGSYTVTLRVTDSKNNTNETQITAQVKNVNELTPKFVWNPQIPTVGKTVNFYDRSLTPSGRSLKTWSWTFEDGSPATSTSPNPEVTFNSSGPKSVTLMVTDDLDNSSSTSKVIDVRNIAPQWREVIPK